MNWNCICRGQLRGKGAESTSVLKKRKRQAPSEEWRKGLWEIFYEKEIIDIFASQLLLKNTYKSRHRSSRKHTDLNSEIGELLSI